MKVIGDYVVYRRDLCEIVDIKEKYFNNKDYYILVPVRDKTLKLSVPVENENLIRDLISVQEINDLISSIPQIEPIDIQNRNVEIEYQKLLQTGKHEDLIRIIKTTYLRNQDRINHHKKVGEKDNYYFNLAEMYLYTELAQVLNMDYDSTKEYIIKKVKESNK